jgi:hypothetical protein
MQQCIKMLSLFFLIICLSFTWYKSSSCLLKTVSTKDSNLYRIPPKIALVFDFVSGEEFITSSTILSLFYSVKKGLYSFRETWTTGSLSGSKTGYSSSKVLSPKGSEHSSYTLSSPVIMLSVFFIMSSER